MSAQAAANPGSNAAVARENRQAHEQQLVNGVRGRPDEPVNTESD